MNKLDWRIVTELVTAISIVVSLVFVGLELRETSAIARADAYLNTTTNAANTLQEVALDPSLANLMRRTIAGEMPETFNDDERFRIFVYFSSLVQLTEGRFRAAQAGLIPMEQIEGRPAAGGGFNNPYFRRIWCEI